MPITKSAKKAMRQTQTRTERNKSTKTMVKTFEKKVMVLSKSNPEEAKKILPKAYKVMDTACKKNLLHKNTVARKKSKMAKAINAAEGKNA